MKTILTRFARALILIGVATGIMSAMATVWLDYLSLKGFRVIGASSDIHEIKTAISRVAQTHVPDWFHFAISVLDRMAHLTVYPGLLIMVVLIIFSRKPDAAPAQRVLVKSILICLGIAGILLVYLAQSRELRETMNHFAYMSEAAIEVFPDRTLEEDERDMAKQLQFFRDRIRYNGMSITGFALVAVALAGVNRKGCHHGMNKQEHP